MASIPIARSQTNRALSPAGWCSGPAIVAYIGSIEFLIHLPNPGGYGFFIDELYFMAYGEHLAFGYVDMPPLTALQAWAARGLFGQSLFGIRLFPILAAAGLVLLTGALVRQLGGERFAQVLARPSGAAGPVLPGVLQLPVHELGRTADMDRMCADPDPHDKGQRPEALAMVRPAGGNRAREQKYDAGVWLCIWPLPRQAIAVLQHAFSRSVDRRIGAVNQKATPIVEHRYVS